MDRGTELGIAGGLLLGLIHAAGAFHLGILALGPDTTGRWLTVLLDVARGTPSRAVLAYLLVPGFVASVLAVGVAHVRGSEVGGWDDLKTLLPLVVLPTAGMFLVGMGVALDSAVRVVGAFGLPLALPFALFFVAAADGILFVATAASVAAGYALVRVVAFVSRPATGQ